MAWTTPKTNWKASDGLSYTDMNRIEGNEVELNNSKVSKTGDTMTGNLITANDRGIDGQGTDNTVNSLIKMNASNNTEVGSGKPLWFASNDPANIKAVKFGEWNRFYKMFNEANLTKDNVQATLGVPTLAAGLGQRVGTAPNNPFADMNLINDTVFGYVGSAGLNKPHGVTGAGVLNIAYNNTPDAGYRFQLVGDWTRNAMFIRSQRAGTYTSWAEVYTEANKPTAQECGALPVTNPTGTGILTLGQGSDTGKAKFGAEASKVIMTNTKANKELAIQDDGQLMFGGKQVHTMFNAKAELWRGAVWPTDSIYTPSKNINDCMTGWCFVWSDANPGQTPLEKNWNWVCSLVPKSSYQSGNGTLFPVPIAESAPVVAVKGITILAGGGQFQGQDSNRQAPNNDAILRYVYEY